MKPEAQLTNGSLCLANLAELDDATTFRPGPLEKDFSQFNLTCRLEELDQIFIRGGPGKLYI
jgi:hypothetical protein